MNEKDANASKVLSMPMEVEAEMSQNIEETAEDIVRDTGRLFVRNLTFGCTEEDLQKFFTKFGPLSEVHMPLDKETKRPIGYAYVLYLLPEHALRAFREAQGTIFQGRILHILPGKERPEAKKNDDVAAIKSVKKKKAIERKANAHLDFNWGTLFMNVITCCHRVV